MKTIVTITLTAIFLMSAITGNMNVKAQQQASVELSGGIIEAVKNIDIVSLNVLLAEGAEIDTVDQNGNTPLMLASEIGNPRMLNIILVHNPNIHTKNNHGETALMIAAKHGQRFAVQQLIERGADMYAKNNDGFTSIELASRYGHSRVASLLRYKTDLPISR